VAGDSQGSPRSDFDAMTIVLDGRATSATIREELREKVAAFRERTGVQPKLAAVLVGDDPASQVYVGNKQKACEAAGMGGGVDRLPESVSEQELVDLVGKLNDDPTVHGILVQLPLPKQIDSTRILDLVHPLKDVDCFHPENVGLLCQGRPRYLPCTPFGMQTLLARYDLPIADKHVVVLGRSDIVGKPIGLMLLQRDSRLGPAFANATVTVCHSRTPNLAEMTRQADVLVAAIGKAKFVTREMVKEGAIVLDVGINRVADKLVGDVDYDAVAPLCLAITPVPKGVGPMTIAMLLHNTLQAADLITSKKFSS
jgi:methylenetetrahydrofolate dehydrogenase (NADP+)/methenyltetrahydrofolate cyclohydrolase